jgi:hypothetical protein
MLSPDYLARVTEGAEEVASMLHTDIVKDIVRRIMIRLDRGDDYVLTSTDKWQIETLMEAGYLREDIIRDIANRAGLQREVIRRAFIDSGVRNLAFDSAVYEAAGIATRALEESPAVIRILQAMYERTMGEWVNITQTTADASQRLFIELCDKAYTKVMTGAQGRSGAVRDAIEEVAKEGVRITYPSGHSDTIEVATARAVRTGITQSASEVTLARMEESGIDLVLTSSHLGARPTHAVWQGKVFHVGGPTEKYPDLVQATGYGTVTGLCGANCRHSMIPYIEGITTNPFEHYDSEENRKQYELEQNQRYLERNIRKVKREVQALQEAVEMASDETKAGLFSQYKKRSQRLTELNKRYKSFCETNDLKTRQDRLHIAGWTKQAAAKAAGAARSKA